MKSRQGGLRRRDQRHAGRRSPKASCRAADWRCCAHRCRRREETRSADGDERTGVLILRRALEAPTRQIAENSAVDGGVVVKEMRAGSGAIGFDAARGEYVDLVEAGIIDPTKVVRLALENAVSVASVLLLTEATLTEMPGKRRRRTHAAGRRILEGFPCGCGRAGAHPRHQEARRLLGSSAGPVSRSGQRARITLLAGEFAQCRADGDERPAEPADFAADPTACLLLRQAEGLTTADHSARPRNLKE